jgi:hypothetical protein
VAAVKQKGRHPVKRKRKAKQPANRQKAGKRGNPNIVELGKGTQFQPGVSGNISGRPKSKILSDAYRKKLEQEVPGDPEGRTWAELIADSQAREAANGKTNAAAEIGDRTEGRAPQAFTIGGSLDLDVENIDQKIRALLEKVRLRSAEATPQR